MTFSNLVAICLGVSAVIGAAVGLIKVSMMAWRGLRRVSQLLDDWFGTPGRPGHQDGQLGVMARFDKVATDMASQAADLARMAALVEEERSARVALDGRVAAIESAVLRNGGSSMRDAIDRIEARGAAPRAEAAGFPGGELAAATAA